jgi:hypothetical protein
MHQHRSRPMAASLQTPNAITTFATNPEKARTPWTCLRGRCPRPFDATTLFDTLLEPNQTKISRQTVSQKEVDPAKTCRSDTALQLEASDNPLQLASGELLLSGAFEPKPMLTQIEALWWLMLRRRVAPSLRGRGLHSVTTLTGRLQMTSGDLWLDTTEGKPTLDNATAHVLDYTTSYTADVTRQASKARFHDALPNRRKLFAMPSSPVAMPDPGYGHEPNAMSTSSVAHLSLSLLLELKLQACR